MTWSSVLAGLAAMPSELEEALALVPPDRLGWAPESWGGCPSETFTAIGQVCHLRDIERDGYHVRIRRLLTETHPSLASIESYDLARERSYDAARLDDALRAFGVARAETVERLRGLDEPSLARAGDFAEYGRLTLRGLVHYLRSHDQQHLAGLQWLAGKIASDGC